LAEHLQLSDSLLQDHLPPSENGCHKQASFYIFPFFSMALKDVNDPKLSSDMKLGVSELLEFCYDTTSSCAIFVAK